MIKDIKTLKEFEDNLLRKESLSYDEALGIFEALWQEAMAFGAIPSKDPLAGIENKIKLAKILNSCSKDSLKR